MFCPIATVITTTACLTALAPGSAAAQHPFAAPASVTAPDEVGRTGSVGRTTPLSPSDDGPLDRGSDDGTRDRGSDGGTRDQGPDGGTRDRGPSNRDSYAEARLSPPTVVGAASSTAEITVYCAGGGRGSITARSEAFAAGSVTLPVFGGGIGQDGRTQYRGTARLAGAVGASSQVSVQGACPDGRQWSTPMNLARDNYRGARAGVGSTAGGGVDLGRIGFGAALAGGAACLLWRRTRAPQED
ncbi:MULTISPECIES: hypothetical protein [unclassified Streptomyces]|uniref:hypothetical protein n=1 Tax=unclassified Streptomyces TaxID=2593676 RepID=UPI002E370F59|nr:hypothetical protein [Streptomyces sp. NBC_01280]WSE13186.1 hypothetical protein OG518_07650 [Streptomyces sp. NBC_01397]